MSRVAPPIRIAISHSSRWSSHFIGVSPVDGATRRSPRIKTPLRRQRPQWRQLPNARRLLLLEVDFLVHLGEDVFADARFVFLVNCEERFFHLILFVGSERDDLGLSGLLYRFEGVV